MCGGAETTAHLFLPTAQNPLEGGCPFRAGFRLETKPCGLIPGGTFRDIQDRHSICDPKGPDPSPVTVVDEGWTPATLANFTGDLSDCGLIKSISTHLNGGECQTGPRKHRLVRRIIFTGCAGMDHQIKACLLEPLNTIRKRLLSGSNIFSQNRISRDIHRENSRLSRFGGGLFFHRLACFRWPQNNMIGIRFHQCLRLLVPQGWAVG